jgi:hypothetical protein
MLFLSEQYLIKQQPGAQATGFISLDIPAKSARLRLPLLFSPLYPKTVNLMFYLYTKPYFADNTATA